MLRTIHSPTSHCFTGTKQPAWLRLAAARRRLFYSLSPPLKRAVLWRAAGDSCPLAGGGVRLSFGPPLFLSILLFWGGHCQPHPFYFGPFSPPICSFLANLFSPPPPCHSPVDGALHKKGMAARRRPTREGEYSATWRRSGALCGGQRGTCTQRGKPADRPFLSKVLPVSPLSSTRAGLPPDRRNLSL